MVNFQACDILHLAFLLTAKKTDAMPGNGKPSWNHKSVSQVKNKWLKHQRILNLQQHYRVTSPVPDYFQLLITKQNNI